MSRNILDLTPAMQARTNDLLRMADADGLDLLLTCTLRSPQEQARLFCQSRLKETIEAKARELDVIYGRKDYAKLLRDTGMVVGPKVTNAGPGQSLHQYGLAIDCVVMVDGKPDWDAHHDAWQRYGELCKEAGLEWAGTWKRFREYPHSQMPNIDWRDLIRDGHV